MKTQPTPDETNKPLDVTTTAVLLVIIGIVATSATWIRGYQGNLEKMLLDLVGGLVLGGGSALLYQLVGARERPVARAFIWTASAYGAYVALSLATSTMPASQIVSMITAGALYGAFLTGMIVTPLCAAVAWVRRVRAPSDS